MTRIAFPIGLSVRRVVMILVSLVALASTVWSLHGCASAGPLGAVAPVAGPVIAKKAAKDVIDDAEKAGQNLLSQAERTGNALAARFGNELTVAAANTVLLAGGELDRLVDQLSKEASIAINALSELTEQANSFQKGAFELKDAMALDLRGAMGDIRFFVSKTDFMIQRIDGITQLESKRGGEYKLVVTGLGFGPNTSKSRNRITAFKLHGSQVTFTENRPRANRTEFNLPNAALHFKDNQIVFEPLEISGIVETKKMLGWSSKEYKVPVRLTLMPRFAGRIKVMFATDKLDWVAVTPEPARYTYTTPDHNCSKDCRFFPEGAQKLVAANQRFFNPQIFGREGEGCGWTRNQRATILGGGTILDFWTEAQGSPCTYTYGATIQELKIVGEVPGSKDYNLQFGENLVVDLPAGTKFWRLRGATTAFQTIDVVMDQSGEILKYRRTVDSGTRKRVVYYVAPPKLE